MMLKILLIAISLPGISLASQPGEAPSRSLDGVMAAKAGIKNDIKNFLVDLNLAVKVAVEPVPIPGAENPVWWVIEGQNFLTEKEGETFASSGEIVVCSERMGDCTMRFKVKIDEEINLTSVAVRLKGQSFGDQMFQLAEQVRRTPEITVSNENGRIILRSLK